jgi:TetR/AcrR family transcriptional regulator
MNVDEGAPAVPFLDQSVAGRSRLKPGERRLQILQALAAMLEDPRAERVTTAALAARLGVSEAALYRHFASKAQMFEGLIQFIEESVFGLINAIMDQEADPLQQVRAMVPMLLVFAERNPGMTRVLVGDALIGEHGRLQQRMNQWLDRLEASLRQCFRNALDQGRVSADPEPAVRASALVAWVLGRWLRYVKTGFKRSPTEATERHWMCWLEG